MRALLAALVLPALLTACGGGADTLQGSLGEYYDLSYERVDALLATSELALQYVDEDGEKVAVVTVKVTQAELTGPATVDLARFGNVTGTSGGLPMPPLQSGTLVLNAYAPEDGAEVSGEFDAELAGERGTLSLHGEFETALVDRR